MSCRLAPVWALAFLIVAGPSVQAQSHFSQDLIPSRTALGRVGLERQWMAVVPLVGTERLLKISRSDDLFFAQTDGGVIHTYNAESGQNLWSAQVGAIAPYARPISSNSFGVFVTNANMLIALDRRTGRQLWRYDLKIIPTTGTACDESKLLVGLNTGKLLVFGLKEKDGRGGERIRSSPVLLMNWQSAGQIDTQPLLADRILIFGSSDARVYVSLSDERTPLYRFATGGPIGDGFGTHGTRSLLVPSADNNLYAVDLLTADVLWTFPSGAPIDQAPLVTGEDIFVINRSGNLSVLDPSVPGSSEPGPKEPRWTTQTAGGRFVSVSPTKVYLRSDNNDLIVVERTTGKTIADPAATLQRAGLNLREYNLSFLNRFDDRMYLGTGSGMVVCLRELGATAPRLLKDPKAKPFGYIPPEGIKLLPTGPVSAPILGLPGSEPKEEAPKEEPAPGADAAPAPAPETDSPAAQPKKPE